MKKILTVFAFTAFVAAQASATYMVVLKDGTRYKAKQKWTISGGKALVLLENGQSLQLDPSLIDVKKSEELTKSGITAGNMLDLNPNLPAPAAAPKQESLGSTIRLRTPAQRAAAKAEATTAPAAPPPVSGTGTMSPLVIEKFELAFENVGIFEKKVTSSSAKSLRAELTVDTEDKVFNAISAAAFLIVRNAGVDGAQIDMVELFMKTTNGGAAGRFQMTRAEAEAINNRAVSHHDYFVRNVIY